jgi:hypothetical protein
LVNPKEKGGSLIVDGSGCGGGETPNIALFLETAFKHNTFIFKTPPNSISNILDPSPILFIY